MRRCDSHECTCQRLVWSGSLPLYSPVQLTLYGCGTEAAIILVRVKACTPFCLSPDKASPQRLKQQQQQPRNTTVTIAAKPAHYQTSLQVFLQGSNWCWAHWRVQATLRPQWRASQMLLQLFVCLVARDVVNLLRRGDAISRTHSRVVVRQQILIRHPNQECGYIV